MLKAGADILGSHFLPILEKTLKKIERTAAIEEDVKNDQVSGPHDLISCPIWHYVSRVLTDDYMIEYFHLKPWET